MKRHPALHPLSREHHYLLLHARSIRWLAAGSDRAAPVDALLAGLRHDWQRFGSRHLAEEEQLWLPAATADGDAETQRLVDRVRAAHASLRRQIEALDEQASSTELSLSLARLGRALHDQVRLEERRLFPHLEALWSDDRFESLAVAAAEFRDSWGDA